MQTLSVIVPVYNEEQGIGRTLDELQAVLGEVEGFTATVVCVDDGSRDGTAEILARRPDIQVITHAVNRGYGAALRTGLDSVGSDWIFITDADGTYPVGDLPRLLEATEQAGTAMVVGAREGPGISQRPMHRMARWILKKMVHALTGVMVPDLNSGMRVFRRDVYEAFRHLLPFGFSFTSTITVSCLYSNFGVRYVPIHYAHRIGHSHIRPVQDFFGFAMLILRVATYFEPLKFFLPLSLLVLLGSIGRGVRDVLLTSSIGGLAMLGAVLALQVFAVGIVADVVVRRSAGHGREPWPNQGQQPELALLEGEAHVRRSGHRAG